MPTFLEDLLGRWVDIHIFPDGTCLQKSDGPSLSGGLYRISDDRRLVSLTTAVGQEMERLAMRVRELEGASPPIFPPTTRWESETQQHLSAMEIDLRAAERKIAALLVECLPENGPSISTRLERIRGHLQDKIDQMRETHYSESSKDPLAIVIDRICKAGQCAEEGSAEAKELLSVVRVLKRYRDACTL